jgi:hypothetical protein
VVTRSTTAPSRPLPPPRSAAAAANARSSRLAAAERRLAFVSRILDDLVTVPGTRQRIGVEPVIGLIPGAGDILSAAVGVWLIAEAARFRLPGSVIGRMVLNTLVDLVVGIVPVLGDLFDFAFKSNTRNLALFRQYAADPAASTREHRLILLGAIAVIVGVAWLLLELLAWLLSIEVSL